MSDSVPSHRAFLSVELPFVLPASGAECAPSSARKVESYLPAPTLCRLLTNSASTSAPAAGDEGGGSTYDLTDAQKYSSEPQCSEWVGFDWSSDDESEEQKGSSADGTVKRRKLEKNRRDTTKVAGESENFSMDRDDLFPSLTPRVLIQSYCRNDVVMRVKRRRRVRRVMVGETVIREEALSGGEGEEAVETEVLGVVSREVEMVRPADFSFSLFTAEEKGTAPESCHGDIFPAAHFIHEKAPFEVNYEVGRRSNSVVTAAEESSSSPAGTHQAIVSDDFALPLCFAQPTDKLPPEPLPEQLNILKVLGCSPTGLEPNDPIEVQAVARLLQQRPVWIVRDLMEAVMQTGVCPRGFFNKRIANALTYVLPVGAFNRLRIRLDFNPYLVPTSVIYQRVGIRLFRRSMEGMLLRDISRAEKLEQAIQILRGREPFEPWRVAASSPPSAEGMVPVSAVPRCSLRESLLRVIQGGNLYIACQLVDVMESERIKRIVLNVLMGSDQSGEELLMSRRAESCGWLEPQAYTAVISAYTAALVKLIEEEVAPLLRELDTQGQPEKSTVAEETPLEDTALMSDDEGEWSSHSSFSGSAVVSSDEDGFDEEADEK